MSAPGAWLHEVRLLAIALHGHTRMPLPAWIGQPPPQQARQVWQTWQAHSARHLPAVGLLVGSLGALVLWAAAHAWPALVTVLLSLATMAWFTAARHEAGLAASVGAAADSPAGEPAAAGPAQAFSLPGVLTLVAVLALKAAALLGLAQRDLLVSLAVLPLACGLSYAATVVLRALRPAAAGGRVDPLASSADAGAAEPLLLRRVDGLGLLMACLWALIALIGAALSIPLPALAAALAAVLGVAWVLARAWPPKPGGWTGAGLGAVQQFSELAVYLAVLAMISRG